MIVLFGIFTYLVVSLTIISGLKRAPLWLHRGLAGTALTLATIHAFLVITGFMGR